MYIESFLPKLIRKVIYFPPSVTKRSSFLQHKTKKTFLQLNVTIRKVPRTSWKIRNHYELVQIEMLFIIIF